MTDLEIPVLPEGLQWYYFPKENGYQAPCCGKTFTVAVTPEPDHPEPYQHLLSVMAMGPKEAIQEGGKAFVEELIPFLRGVSIDSVYFHYGHHAEEVRRFTAERLQAAADALRSEEPLAAEPDEADGSHQDDQALAS